MVKGDIVAANVQGISYSIGAVAEVLKISYGGKAIVRFINGWKVTRDQIITIENFRIIPKE